MSNAERWMAKALLISAVIAVVVGVGFYLFFRIHQELDFSPTHAWELGLLALVISIIALSVYFRNRTGH